MSKAKLRVADVLRCYWHEFNSTHRLPPFVAHTVSELLKCRTAALGGHIYKCDQCGSEIPVYNSCQNRNCPTCQNTGKEKWLQRRLRDVLPVPYYHVVFTLPHELNNLVNGNRCLLLNELFQSGSWVLQRFAHDQQWRLEGELGMLAILHTWNQQLFQHFHVHYLIPGGAWRENTKEFVVCKGNWLFKKASLADAFRNRFIKRLQKLRSNGQLSYSSCCYELEDEQNWNDLIEKLQSIKWVVYPKRVPATPEKALEYLARYSHRVAISDYRIQKIENDHATFSEMCSPIPPCSVSLANKLQIKR
ncbi:MAG: transposase [Bacteroidia bacterium]|nr:transposase [Bacteroidia bacterium]